MILSTMSAKNVTCCCYIGNENLYYEFMGNSYSTKPTRTIIEMKWEKIFKIYTISMYMVWIRIIIDYLHTS